MWQRNEKILSYIKDKTCGPLKLKEALQDFLVTQKQRTNMTIQPESIPILFGELQYPNACRGREWPTSFVFLNFEYESNGFCKYSKGEICWHGVGENYRDLKKI